MCWLPSFFVGQRYYTYLTLRGSNNSLSARSTLQAEWMCYELLQRVTNNLPLNLHLQLIKETHRWTLYVAPCKQRLHSTLFIVFSLLIDNHLLRPLCFADLSPVSLFLSFFSFFTFLPLLLPCFSPSLPNLVLTSRSLCFPTSWITVIVWYVIGNSPAYPHFQRMTTASI